MFITIFCVLPAHFGMENIFQFLMWYPSLYGDMYFYQIWWE